MTRLANRLLLYVFIFMLLEAVWSVPELNWEVALARTGPLGWIIASVAAAFALLFLWLLRRRIIAGLQSIAARATAVSTISWFFGCFAAGMLLRFLWLVRYSAPLRSDYATYFGLAKGLVDSHVYGSTGTGLAFWPPGYPFFLYALFSLFGVHSWIPFLGNAILFAGTLAAVGWLAKTTVDDSVARLATLLLVFWPCYFMSGELASKEMLILCLIPVSLALYLNSVLSASSPTRVLCLPLSGLAVGLMALTQPSLMLFPAVFLGYEILRLKSLASAFLRLVVVSLITALVILPWTIRNHRVLGSWVPVSTNGGDVFYRANNDKANGGFTDGGAQSMSDMDEVSRSKLGFQLGKEWIRQHPGHFLVLALRKQILFLGDDATGAYETLKRGLGMGGIQYVAWKGLSNLSWWILCLLMVLAILWNWRDPVLRRPEIGAVLLAILYLYAMHSVFESGGKYHVPLLGMFSLVASLCAFQGHVGQPKQS